MKKYDYKNLLNVTGSNIQNMPNNSIILVGKYSKQVVQLFGFDHLGVGHDVVCGTEVHAVLGLLDATNQRSCKI